MKLSPAILLLLLPALTLAEVYKWVDKDGNLHFSDQPPPEEVESSETVDVSDSQLSESQRQAAQRLRELNQARRAQENAQQQASSEPDPAIMDRQQEEQRQRACQAARTNLQIMESGGRVFDVDAQGERQYLDDAERAKRLAYYKEKVAEYCR